MQVLSACPLRVASLAWQPRPGAFALTVVCKATYRLVPGTAPLASVQEEPHSLDAWWGDNPRASLRHAGDLAPFKRRADVLLVGHAYAPGGQPVPALTARLVVGEIDKAIAAYGNHSFAPDGRIGEPSPFTKMPLRWERAAGGRNTANPVGVPPETLLGSMLVPNLQPPETRIQNRRDTVKPVGFGPVAPSWPGRLAHLRGQAASWDPRRWHERPLPDGIDAGYFNAAPPDQQVSDIPPDAHLVLTNLHPEHAQLVTSLQPIVPRAVSRPGTGPAQEIRLRCDTLCIDTDRAVVCLIWRGVVPLNHPEQIGQIVVTAEGASAASPRVDVAAVALHAATTAFDLASLPARVALPFTPGSGLQSVEAAPSAQALPGLGLAHARFGGTTGIDPAIVQGAALPFAPGSGLQSAEAAPSALALPGLARAHAQFGGTTDLDPAIVRSRLAVPFGSREHAEGRGSTPAIAELPAPPRSGETMDQGPAESIWARGGLPIAPVVPVPDPPSALFAAPLSPIARPDPASVPLPGVAVDPLHLVWFTREIVPVVRKDPRWSPILDGLDQRPLDPDLDDPDLADDVADLDERREVFEILARGSALGAEGVAAALAAAVRSDGGFVQPLVLVAGELVFPFDELEALKAMASAAAPYAGADSQARAILDLAKEFLGSPGQPSAPAVAEGLTTRIRETFEVRTLVAAGFLDAQIGRALLRGRHHQRRRVLGGLHVRASLNAVVLGDTPRPPGAGPAIPVYLNHRAAARLPAGERLRARMLVFVHPTVEQNETHSAALRVVALAVVNAPLARR